MVSIEWPFPSVKHIIHLVCVRLPSFFHLPFLPPPSLFPLTLKNSVQRLCFTVMQNVLKHTLLFHWCLDLITQKILKPTSIPRVAVTIPVPAGCPGLGTRAVPRNHRDWEVPVSNLHQIWGADGFYIFYRWGNCLREIELLTHMHTATSGSASIWTETSGITGLSEWRFKF